MRSDVHSKRGPVSDTLRHDCGSLFCEGLIVAGDIHQSFIASGLRGARAFRHIETVSEHGLSTIKCGTTYPPPSEYPLCDQSHPTPTVTQHPTNTQAILGSKPLPTSTMNSSHVAAKFANPLAAREPTLPTPHPAASAAPTGPAPASAAPRRPRGWRAARRSRHAAAPRRSPGGDSRAAAAPRARSCG